MISKPIEAEEPAASGMDVEIRLSRFENGFCWQDLFGTAGPVVVEIGCGKGRFIIRSARENPGINYFGIERATKFFHLLKQRCQAAGVDNLRLLKGDADYLIRKYVPGSSVRAYHVLFPDPWPKKRHRKRRLVSPAFAAEVCRTLEPAGCIFFATDYAEYFEQMVEVAGACTGLQERCRRVIDPESADPESADTNYERKYLLQGRTIYRAVYQKG